MRKIKVMIRYCIDGLCILILSLLLLLYLLNDNFIKWNADFYFNPGMIFVKTTGYNTFTGWDWIINKNNIALGFPKDGVLKDFQHKVHYYDGNVENIFIGGEFFCDPDDVLFIPAKQHIAYLPYLKWEKDVFISNDRDFARLSFKSNSSSSFKDGVVKNINAPLVDIRLDKTMQKEKNFIDARVYLTNRYEESIDIVYVAQDAAYMYLPDNSQNNVDNLVIHNNQIAEHGFTFGKLSAGDVVSTFHKNRGFIGGYIVREGGASSVWGGVIPSYAFFGSHQHMDSFPGYADVSVIQYKDAFSLREALVDQVRYKMLGNTLKNRILMFSFERVEPGQTVVATYYQFGAVNFNDLRRQLTEESLMNIANALPNSRN